MPPEAMSILPRFSHTSGADLEAHRVPSRIISFVEQHRDHLQRAAQNRNEFRASLTSTKNPSLDSRSWIEAPAFQGGAQPHAPVPQQPQQPPFMGPAPSIA